jgi:hypothetical protein
LEEEENVTNTVPWRSAALFLTRDALTKWIN